MPSNQSPRQRQKWLANVEHDVLCGAVKLHTQLGRDYVRAGRRDLANDEAESARRALKRAREISKAGA